MDEYWNNQVLEFGAINITGFRVLQTNTHEFRQFAKSWRSLDGQRWPGAGTDYFSVRYYNWFWSDLNKHLLYLSKSKVQNLITFSFYSLPDLRPTPLLCLTEQKLFWMPIIGFWRRRQTCFVITSGEETSSTMVPKASTAESYPSRCGSMVTRSPNKLEMYALFNGLINSIYYFYLFNW